ncbi:MAG: metallophosphoesterase family protein, partial [Anaerolineales bacterium]
ALMEVKPGNTIAVIADIHGNSLALNAVLDDVAANGGADAYWFLGDYFAIGHDPLGVIRILDGVENATFIRGNTDRFVADGSLPWPNQNNVIENPELLSQYVSVARSFAWTTGALGASGKLDWCRELPLDFQTAFPDGTKVLAVHASPGEDDGDGVHLGLSDAELSVLVSDAGADLVLVGHTHFPQDRLVSGIRVASPGSVSNPLPPDLRAKYVTIELRSDGYDLQFHQVDYDRDEIVQAAKAVNHPASEYIAVFMEGKRVPEWLKRYLSED